VKHPASALPEHLLLTVASAFVGGIALLRPEAFAIKTMRPCSRRTVKSCSGYRTPGRKNFLRSIRWPSARNLNTRTVSAPLEIFIGSGTLPLLAISGLYLGVIGTLPYTGIFWVSSQSSLFFSRRTARRKKHHTSVKSEGAFLRYLRNLAFSTELE
jgi:hypothetical protein